METLCDALSQTLSLDDVIGVRVPSAECLSLNYTNQCRNLKSSTQKEKVQVAKVKVHVSRRSQGAGKSDFTKSMAISKPHWMSMGYIWLYM